MEYLYIALIFLVALITRLIAKSVWLKKRMLRNHLRSEFKKHNDSIVEIYQSNIENVSEDEEIIIDKERTFTIPIPPSFWEIGQEELKRICDEETQRYFDSIDEK
jgi:hypothetical protein